MRLDEYLDANLGEAASTDLSAVGPFSSRVRNLIGNESLTHAVVANAFWQAYIHSSVFPIRPSGLSTSYQWDWGGLCRIPADGSELYVARHAFHSGGRPRFDMLVIDPRATTNLVVPARPTEAELRTGWQNFAARLRGSSYLGDKGVLGEIARDGMVLALEASRAQEFRLLVVPANSGTTGTPHAVVATAALLTENAESATAGVIATNAAGQHGVTVAAHTVSPSATHAKVAGTSGQIVSRDALTDSCFVEIDPSAIPGAIAAQPMRGIVPRPLEKVHFDGCASGPVSTHVIATSPELPFRIPLVQLRVLTNAVTNPGDSGAALLTDSNEVVGFSLARSGFGQPFEYSIWVWAESVFAAHGLN